MEDFFKEVHKLNVTIKIGKPNWITISISLFLAKNLRAFHEKALLPSLLLFLILLNCGKEATERETISYTLQLLAHRRGSEFNGGYYTEGTQVSIQATPNAFINLLAGQWFNRQPLAITVNGNLNLRQISPRKAR